MTQESFVGTWRLVSLESRTADGQISYPWGRDAVGYIMYTQGGYMSVSIMRSDRAKFASGDVRGASKEQKAWCLRK